MSEPMLTLTGICKSYNPGQANEVTVLQSCDLTLMRGEVAALVAPSGSGKSTLLHIAGLLDTADSGRLQIAGRDMSRADDRLRTDLRRMEIGFVYQFHHLLPEFTAAENIMLPQQAAGKAAGPACKRALELLDQTGLAERADHRPSELSGGEQQRVAFCRALANAPKLLLADEPTGNLDPETSDHVFDVLMGLVRSTGMAALIATHNMELAGRMDRQVRLSKGQIV
ncbi:MAG: ABC transporter ATP-binding protein [Planktomarina sp.]|uniref:ABC transporter ATP-binding protein n=1 Tax=Planktomarina sp. TaxID=2024851 RepID=UPI0032600F90|nr:ABC transporter ATP-binding protein [Planktomarina sp.]